jgi:hypothetical protein
VVGYDVLFKDEIERLMKRTVSVYNPPTPLAHMTPQPSSRGNSSLHPRLTLLPMTTSLLNDDTLSPHLVPATRDDDAQTLSSRSQKSVASTSLSNAVANVMKRLSFSSDGSARRDYSPEASSPVTEQRPESKLGVMKRWTFRKGSGSKG